MLVALTVWGKLWTSTHVPFFCDNEAVVQVIGNSRTKDPFLAACLRNIWLITATHDIVILLQGPRTPLLILFLDYFHLKKLMRIPWPTLSKILSGTRFPMIFLIWPLIYNFFSYVLGGTPGSLLLMESVWDRIDQAYRPSTLAAHTTHFKTFLVYLIFIKQENPFPSGRHKGETRDPNLTWND